MSAAAERQWVLCPRCGGKTRLQILRETELRADSASPSGNCSAGKWSRERS